MPFAHLTIAFGCLIMALADWWCHFVRYPAFRTWPVESFTRRHQVHTLQISPIVIPGMMLQLAGTGWLHALPATPILWKIIHVALCFASVGPTLLISGPLHGRLAGGKSPELIDRLIRSNLPRSIVWSTQAALAFVAALQNWVVLQP